SGLVMYPAGHARNRTADLDGLLTNKWGHLGDIASPAGADGPSLAERFMGLGGMSAEEVSSIHDFEIADREPIE
ncbi:MAG: hypothetical protein AAF235_12265, partial [Planctomycetota bacterium]